MSINHLRGAGEWALMVALVFGAGAIAQAQDNKSQKDGPVVQIGRADGDEAKPNLPPPNGGSSFQAFGVPNGEQVQLPKYWIGLLGGAISADHPLRTHLDLPENQGLLVADIVPKSPAEKAGLKKNDIILRANDKDLHEMTDLVEMVATEGEKKGQVTIEVFRHGNRESLTLTPEERPADAGVSQSTPNPFGGGGGGGGGGFGGEGELPRELLERFQSHGSNPFAFRNFGNGVIVGGGGHGIAGLPNGVSMSVQKENGQPPKVTVTRGDETWNIVGDDPKSLEQLPEDLRPFVEQMLHGGGQQEFNFRLPDVQGPEGTGDNDGRLRERLDRMEKRMQELMDRVAPENRPAAPQNEKEQSK